MGRLTFINMKQTQKHFYHSVVSMDSLRVRLDLFDFSDLDKDQLMELAERTLHHAILDLVLSELSDKDKTLFLKNHAAEKHEEIWSLLNSNIKNIQKKIRVAADSIAQKLHNDLKRIKKTKNSS